MRFSLAVAVALASISVSAVAQQNNTFKVKPSHTEKAPRSTEKAPRSSVPVGKTVPRPASTSGANRDLRGLEHQTAKSSAPIGSAGQRTPGKALALKPAKTKPNPPIKFNASGAAKSAGTNSHSSHPYKGRLRQKSRQK